MADRELYLGLISGTSADGIDAAICTFAAVDADARDAAPSTHNAIHVVAAQTYPYPADLREHIVALARSRAHVALDDYGQLDVHIGECFAQAALALLSHANLHPRAITAIGSHGQTVCHRPHGAYPFTLQIGDASVIAERTGITTVADFRRADVAAGGQGAPLLPALHAAVLADAQIPRAILNLGGIGNLSLLVPGQPVLGFDTGPANCLLDAWTLRQRGATRDEGGAWARSGSVNHGLLARCLDDAYFAASPPKSTGREVFNLDWLDARIGADIPAADVQATLLALSARSIADALRTHAPAVRELYACGGGVHNGALMDALRAELPNVRVETTAALGLDPDFVEAAGFAWLARARLLGIPGNLPAVTGASGPRLLGAIYPAPS
ncbi:MAG: anhydro-N-acetylmuramic acid kinase [Proteobacteria bacterium]|nr:anhydro-N-acetylmuramic acid kinase [Pseudomonadota bacterium]MBS0464717.1 anhydro-N-acetylmuramic acid kinase [Pseudomonadota bacterium]